MLTWLNVSAYVLGFSWIFNGTTKYYIFTVLLFALSTEPFVFTKAVRPLAKFWRFPSTKIDCLFLDKGLGIEYKFLQGRNNSSFVRYTLTAAVLIPNSNKSIWTPCQKISWLGSNIDITNKIIKITWQNFQ